ncbi:unnamed protein product, partial [Polarella glacialis]
VIAYVQRLEEGRLKRVACFAVSASVRGGDQPNRNFPEGVTTLASGHIAFVLATASLDLSQLGLRRFGFTTTGSFAIFHRCVELPPGCVDKARWEKIRALRAALRAELEVSEADAGDAKWRSAAPVIWDSGVMKRAWELHQAIPHADGSPEANLDDQYDPCPATLAHATVDLQTDAQVFGLQALKPFADWPTLISRRNIIVEKQRTGMMPKVPDAVRRNPREQLDRVHGHLAA